MAIFAVEARKSLVDRNFAKRLIKSRCQGRGSQEPRGSKSEKVIPVAPFGSRGSQEPRGSKSMMSPSGMNSSTVEVRKSLVDRNRAASSGAEACKGRGSQEPRGSKSSPPFTRTSFPRRGSQEPRGSKLTSVPIPHGGLPVEVRKSLVDRNHD